MVDRNARRPASIEKHAGDADPENSWFETFLLQYFKESTLWPVAFVVLVHAAAFLAPIILFALRDRGLPAMAAMAALVGVSLRFCGSDWRRRRFGPISGLLLGVWGLAATGAYFANQWQLL
jgi:hypothetical protein